MRQLRVRAVALAAGAIAALPSASSAEPFVGQIGQAFAEVQLVGTDGRLYLTSWDVQIIRPQAGQPTYAMTVGITPCTAYGECVQWRRYLVPLDATAVTAAEDMTAVRVQTSALGTPIVLSWTTAPSGPAPDARVIVTTPVRSEASTVGTNWGSFGGKFWAAQCHTQAWTTNSFVVADAYAPADGAPAPRTVPPQFAKRGTRSVSCAPSRRP